MNAEEEAMKAYAEAGVDLPELKEEQPAKEEAPTEPTPKEEEPSIEPLKTEPKEERKPRSIYDEYKDKKEEVKTERQLREQAEREREQAERERDELKEKLEAIDTASSPQERREAQDELEAYAQEIGADPQALRKMREIFLKDVQPTGLSDDDRKAIEEIRAFKAQNQAAIERQQFEDEFKQATPSLKEYFPSASDTELEAIKQQLDTLSHTKEWHDKSLDYIAFKHKDTLSALVSPRKRGMESKGRADTPENSPSEFDMEADLSKMTHTEREQWSKTYAELTKTDGLSVDSNGKRTII